MEKPIATQKAIWRVVDGGRNEPMGLVGYCRSRQEALDLCAISCRMGGIISLIFVSVQDAEALLNPVKAIE